MPKTRFLATVCFLCCGALALFGPHAHAADMDSITDKLGSIFHKSKDKAVDLLEKGGQAGRELRDNALRKGDELLDTLDKSLGGTQDKPAGDVYSRLSIRNLCDKSVAAHIAELGGTPGYNAGEVDARSQQTIEVWQGVRAPRYTYIFRQRGDTAPKKGLPLADILQNSEKSLVHQGGTTFHDYAYTICRNKAPLAVPPSHAPSTAAPANADNVPRGALSR